MSGPVATIAGPASGNASTRRVSNETPGSRRSSSPTRRENAARSTASARPAGTAVSSATRTSREPARRSSSLSSPTALESDAPRSEFEQTSSAKPSAAWASVRSAGFMSTRRTGTPRAASWNAASQPASPAPITVTGAARPAINPRRSRSA